MAAVAVAAQVAELRQHPAFEPAQQLRPFGIVDSRGVGAHRLAHFRPVGHGGMNVGQGRAQLALQPPPLARVDPHSLDVDHRFAPRVLAPLGSDLAQRAVRVAAGMDHRVDQPVDRQPLRRDRRRDRIDQERHVVVDQRDAHEAPLVGGGSERDRRFTRFPPGRRLEHETGRVAHLLGRERRVAGQERIADPVGQRADERGGNGLFALRLAERRSCSGTHRNRSIGRSNARPKTPTTRQ